MNILFCDVETSGIYYDKNAILSICWAVYSLEEKRVIDSYYSLVSPDSFYVDRCALEVNKINLFEALETGIKYSEIVNRLSTTITQYNISVIAGWNITFDRKFIEEVYKKVGLLMYSVVIVKWYDVMQNFFFSGLENNKLETVAKAYNIQHEPHNNLSDVEATIKLFEVSR